MSRPSATFRDRATAVLFTVWAGTVTAAFVAANIGFFVAKLTERGVVSP